ncbi:MAG TPA: hypothetical protein VN700_04930 [Vicinamibacterales bacterium]|nr:hypothetical protein [Vicinamibacterales bacterium]
MEADSRRTDRLVPSDTSPEAWAIQTDLYARMGGAARLSTAFQLTETVRRLTFAGIRRRHPHYTDVELRQAWARITLGDETCRAVWPDLPLVEP